MHVLFGVDRRWIFCNMLMDFACVLVKENYWLFNIQLQQNYNYLAVPDAALVVVWYRSVWTDVRTLSIPARTAGNRLADGVECNEGVEESDNKNTLRQTTSTFIMTAAKKRDYWTG